MSALRSWRRQLLGRAVPPQILDAAPESPWGFPRELFRRRAERAAGAVEETPTTRRARHGLPLGGVVLDVGAGGGATSLPLADAASRIVGVDEQADMLETFGDAVRAAGAEAVTVEGSWPGAADRTPFADVAVCGHVLYNVPDLAPFVTALDAHAAVRVVVELTDRHPLVWMNDLWELFHGLSFPEGPTADDAATILRELGLAPARDERIDRRDQAAGGGFARREDAVHLVRRRLCLTPDRDAEVVEALGDRLYEDGGVWSAGPEEQTVVTLWWDTARRS